MYPKEISTTTKNHASEKYSMIREHMIHGVLVFKDGCHHLPPPCGSPSPMRCGVHSSTPLNQGQAWGCSGLWKVESSVLGPLSPRVKKAWQLLGLCSWSPKPHVRSPGYSAGKRGQHREVLGDEKVHAERGPMRHQHVHE